MNFTIIAGCLSFNFCSIVTNCWCYYFPYNTITYNIAFHTSKKKHFKKHLLIFWGSRSCTGWMQHVVPMLFRLLMTCLKSILAVCHSLIFKGSSILYSLQKNPFWVNFLQMKAMCTMVILHWAPSRRETTLLKSVVHMNFTHSCFVKCLNYLL